MSTFAYVILGYGVPKDIRRDLNYQLYLRSALNTVYADLLRRPETALVVCSGGRTDMFRPYRRTEAGEMVAELRRMSRALPPATRRRIRFQVEPRSYSTLENIAFVRPRLGRIKHLTFFCEYLRAKRVGILVRMVYGPQVNIRVRGVDFDASSNRYLEPELIRKKERAELRFARWSFRSAKNMRRHHEVYTDKVRRFRVAGSKNHLKSVRAWFEETIKRLPEIEREG